MEKQWFVLQSLTGQESKALKSIEARVKLERMEDFVGRAVIPTERVVEKRDGKKRVVVKKFFPGYVLCELALYDESKGLDDNGRKAIIDRTWQFVRGTSGLIGFVGVDSRDPNARPRPLTQAEVDAILLDKPQQAAAVERPKVVFNINDPVRLCDGAFNGQIGSVTMVDPDKGKLKVEVSVFGRKVPVDVEYYQVRKISLEELQQAESKQ